MTSVRKSVRKFEGDLEPYANALGTTVNDLLQVTAGEGYEEVYRVKPAWPAFTSADKFRRVSGGAWLKVVDAATVRRGDLPLIVRKKYLALDE